MAKASKKTDLTPEEQAFLDERQARADSAKSNSLQMKQLTINTDSVNEDNERITPGTFNIRGEKEYSESIKFIPIELYNKYIRSVKNGKQWKTENETIFTRGFEPPLDMKGGIACGRLLGKAIPSGWNEAQRLDNSKRATCYAFLFGLVIFPGKEPVLVNFRASPAKARVIREAYKNIDASRAFDYIFNMKLVPVAGTVHPSLEIETAKSEDVSYGTIMPSDREIQAFVIEHNNRIMATRERVEENVKASKAFDTVKSLASDFEEDTIPF